MAEYFNFSSFVLSFPFQIDLPKTPEDNEEIHYISNSDEYPLILEKVVSDPEYHQKVAKGGKKYFDTYCTPEAQATYILKSLLID